MTLQALETDNDTVDAARAAWLEERTTGIGGSDAAAAVGLSSHKTPYELWLEKTGQAPLEQPDTERMRWGRELENVIALAYMERTGRRVHRVNRLLRNAERPYMIANLDRRIVGEKRGLEIKNVDSFAAKFGEWGEPGTDQVPTTYAIQVAHYLAVTGYEAFDVAALVGGNDLRIYTIARDEELIDLLRVGEEAFWRNVETRTPPNIRSIEDARARYPRSIENAVIANSDVIEDLATLRLLKEQAKGLDEKIDVVTGRICGFIGECDTLKDEGGTVLATWKTQFRKGYEVKPSESRRFLVKGA